MTIEPTDAEIVALMRDGNNCNYNDEGEHIDFARAVLARWGQPAHSGEPVAWMRDWDVYDPTNSGPELSHTKKERSKGWVPLYTTPPPVGRGPLTPEQIDSAYRKVWSTVPHAQRLSAFALEIETEVRKSD